MRSFVLAALAVCLAASPALADEADAGLGSDAGHVAPLPAPAREGVVVMNLATVEATAALSPPATATLAHRLSEAKLKILTQSDIAAAIGQERQKAFLGCGESGCLAELGDALGARFVVSGRVDKVGSRFLLTAGLWDGVKTEVIARARQEAEEEGELTLAAERLADELLPALGVSAPPPTTPAGPAASGLNLSLKLGTQLLTSIVSLAPQADLELGWRTSREWAFFLQVSAGVAFAQSTTVTATPGLVGVRRFFRVDHELQPFLGGGAGVMTTIDAVRNLARPGLVALGGAQYFVTPRVAIGLEASADLLSAAYEFATTQKSGLNFGLSVGVNVRL